MQLTEHVAAGFAVISMAQGAGRETGLAQAIALGHVAKQTQRGVVRVLQQCESCDGGELVVQWPAAHAFCAFAEQLPRGAGVDNRQRDHRCPPGGQCLITKQRLDRLDGPRFAHAPQRDGGRCTDGRHF